MSFISVKNGYLVNENGEEIVLKGVNLGNWLLWETWMGFVPEYTEDWACFDTLEVLLERFGEEKTNEMIENMVIMRLFILRISYFKKIRRQR